jgi:hypothetical protein
LAAAIRATTPTRRYSGGVSLPGLAQEFIAFNTRRHCLGLLAQAMGFPSETFTEGLKGIIAAFPLVSSDLASRLQPDLDHVSASLLSAFCYLIASV